jgi:hypothetical protein
VVLVWWSLLFQPLVPLLHVLPTEGATAGIPAWELASICHVDFPATAVDQDRSQPKRPAPGEHPPICPICLGMHIASTFLVPSPLAVPTPIPRANAAFLEDVRLAARPSHRRLIQARAPPTPT